MKMRAPRALRKPEARLRMTARDMEILDSLARLRFATTGQLARLAFEGSRWGANKRLRKLFDAGLVRAWVRSLAQENVYSLDRAGTRALAKPDEAPDFRDVPRGLDGNLDHLLAINQVRIEFALGLPEAGGEITWWRSDWELRSERKERIIPDALFGIRWEERDERMYALELDNNTRSPRKFMKKILGYAALAERAYRAAELTVLVVGKEARWAEQYRRSLAELNLGFGVWFTSLESLEQGGCMAPVWRCPQHDFFLSLRELGFVPYGKEERNREKSVISGGYGVR